MSLSSPNASFALIVKVRGGLSVEHQQALNVWLRKTWPLRSADSRTLCDARGRG